MSSYAEMNEAARIRVREARKRVVENKGGTPTGREKWPWVPSAVMVRLLEPLAADIGWNGIGRRAGVEQRSLYDMRVNRERVGFDYADRLICRALGAPQLWHEVPELIAAYEGRPVS